MKIFGEPIRQPKIVLGAVFLLALGLRLWHLDKQSLWMDEAFSVWVASHSLTNILELLKMDNHPPGFYAFLHFWLQGGKMETYLRLPFVLLGACNVVLIYLTAKNCFGFKTAVLSSVFWAVSFNCMNAETQVRMYGMATCFSLLATWSFQELLKTNSLLSMTRYLLFGILSLYVHYYTVFILLTHVVFSFFLKKYFQSLRMILIFALALSPWSYHFFVQLLNNISMQLPSPQKHDLFTFAKF